MSITGEWLQESLSALSMTPHIDFPSRRSLSLTCPPTFCLPLKWASCVWLITFTDPRSMHVSMCYHAAALLWMSHFRFRLIGKPVGTLTWPKFIFCFICLQLSNKTNSLHFHLWVLVPVGVAGWEMLCFQTSGSSYVSNVQGRGECGKSGGLFHKGGSELLKASEGRTWSQSSSASQENLKHSISLFHFSPFLPCLRHHHFAFSGWSIF